MEPSVSSEVRRTLVGYFVVACLLVRTSRPQIERALRRNRPAPDKISLLLFREILEASQGPKIALINKIRGFCGAKIPPDFPPDFDIYF